MMQTTETTETTPINNFSEPKPTENEQPDNFSDYKRTSSKNSEHSVYNTVRKYNCNSLLNQDSAYTAKSSHNQDEDPDDQQCSVHQPELSVIEQQQSVVSSSLPIRERVGHLLPQFMAANYTLEHIKLIQSQIKLDDLLDFLRLHRQKTKGECLSSIKRTMQGTSFQTQHLKQILFLMPDYYICSQKKDDQGRHDILVSLPEFVQLENRKRDFRKRLYQYLKENDGFGKNRNMKIPSFVFPFTTKEEMERKQSVVNQFKNKNIFLYRSQSVGKINPLDALRPGNSRKFQQLLNAKIKQNEKRILAEKEKQSMVKFGSKQLLAVYDELPKIFKKREKGSMFKSSIIQDLDNSLNIKEEIICKILSVLLEQHSEFFKVIPHKSGEILQIQTKIYNELRSKIEKTENHDIEGAKENEKQQQKPKVESQTKKEEVQKKERNKSCPPVANRGKGKKINDLRQISKRSTKGPK